MRTQQAPAGPGDYVTLIISDGSPLLTPSTQEGLSYFLVRRCKLKKDKQGRAYWELGEPFLVVMRVTQFFRFEKLNHVRFRGWLTPQHAQAQNLLTEHEAELEVSGHICLARDPHTEDERFTGLCVFLPHTTHITVGGVFLLCVNSKKLPSPQTGRGGRNVR